jgi:hypothetical protein
MARPKQKTVVFVVNQADAPVPSVFMRAELATQYAVENGGDSDLTVTPVQVLTEPDIRKAKKEAALALLTPDQQAALGLVKTPLTEEQIAERAAAKEEKKRKAEEAKATAKAARDAAKAARAPKGSK